ncbi:MAG: cytochrome c peroxidase [Bacteroidota bacterium]|nr:cytochrome c peroxidase [Bacteroidota bacterium]
MGFYLKQLVMVGTFVTFYGCSNPSKIKQLYSEQELGEALFFDPILSRDSSISCSSCHKPEFAFADNVAFSKGIYNQQTDRNSPSTMNMRDRNFYFWDGRAETLEEQALGPIESRVEMDLPISLAVRKLIKNERYKNSFMAVYGSMPTRDLMAQAIAAYEKTLETNNTIFDDYISGKDTTQFSESAKRGLDIFNNKGKCFDCHFGPDFTGNDKFRNIGLYNGKDLKDEGRYKITKNPKDLGAFKIPGLRNIAQTAPYMHNGMHKTLKQVIDYYDNPSKFVPNSINRDTLLNKPLNLTETEKKDLENFLLSLSDRKFLK